MYIGAFTAKMVLFCTLAAVLAAAVCVRTTLGGSGFGTKTLSFDLQRADWGKEDYAFF